MYDILIVAATATEIKLFLKNVQISKGECVTVNLETTKINVLVTGVGINNMSYNLTKHLQTNSYSLIILAGISGSYDANINLGEVVYITKDRFADLGLITKNDFTSIFEMGFENPNDFPFSNGWLQNNFETQNEHIKKLPQLTANTVNTIYNFPNNIKTIADTESMEGAAFFYTCFMEKQLCIQIRSISNYVGEADKNKWQINKAINNLNEILEKILRQNQF